MAECSKCIHEAVCETAKACDGFGIGCKHFKEQKQGRWVLTAHEEHCNFRWNVTAECSVCHHSKGEIYAGFFPGFPKDLARDVILDSAESVKLDNYCPNCGADMRGEEDG